MQHYYIPCSLRTCELPRHNTVPIMPPKALFIIIGGLDSFRMRTILMHNALINTAIPLKISVFAKNMTEIYKQYKMFLLIYYTNITLFAIFHYIYLSVHEVLIFLPIRGTLFWWNGNAEEI